MYELTFNNGFKVIASYIDNLGFYDLQGWKLNLDLCTNIEQI